MKMKNLIIIAFVSIFTISCSKDNKNLKEYVIEVTTFKYNKNVDPIKFWKRDKEIETDYTVKQPGFISRESGYSENNNEVLVVVRWNSKSNADASMKKFMSDISVQDYAAMINTSTMKMNRYQVK